MKVTKTHVSSKFQIVIPKAIRKLIPLSPQETLIVYIEDNNKIVLRKEAPSIQSLKGSGTFLEKDYLKKERLSW